MSFYIVLYNGYPDPTRLESFELAEDYVYEIIQREDLDSWRKTGMRCKWYKQVPSDGEWIIHVRKYHDDTLTLQIIEKKDES